MILYKSHIYRQLHFFSQQTVSFSNTIQD